MCSTIAHQSLLKVTLLNSVSSQIDLMQSSSFHQIGHTCQTTKQKKSALALQQHVIAL